MENDSELSANAVGAEGLFLRAADRKRFEYVMQAVCTDGQCLALSSTNDGVLDHYGRLVINRLRQTPGVLIEVFLPANTEALLDRFNQILAGLSLSDARKTTGSHAPRRIMVAHDAKAIDPRDLQLLARLMNDFPGANTSLVLFLDQSRERQHEKALETFGQRLLRWPVEAPTRSEGEALLKVGAMLGFGVEVKKLLAATGVVDAPPPKDSLFASQLAAARQAGRTEPVLEDDEQDQPASSSPGDKKPFTSPSGGSSRPGGRKALRTLGTLARWSVAALLLMTVSVVVITALFPARIAPLLTTSPLAKRYLPPWVVSAVTGITGAPAAVSKVAETLTPAVKPPAPAATPPAETPPAADPAPTPIPTPVPAAQEKPEAAPSVPAATADSQKRELGVEKVGPVAKVDPVTPLAPVVKATPPAKPANDVTPKPATVAEALAPRSESGVDQQVRRAKAGSYVVQHVSLGSMAEAQEWRAQYAVLGKSRIVAVTTQSQGVKFAVVSGPFANRKDAEVFATRPGVPADPWLRPIASLQKALLPAAR